jgi:dipeptidyl aminopeptidase/acylaminoacyl peptidase
MGKNEPIGVAGGRALAKRWLKRAGMISLGAIGSYLTICVGAAYPLSSLLLRPRLKRLRQLKSSHLRRFLAARGIAFEEAHFHSFDGTRLDGWWFEAGADCPTVIALHGLTKNRTDMVRFAIALGTAGINVLLFDGRGHGQSDARFVTYGFYERRDVEAAIDYVVGERGVNEARVGLAGVSMGAAISLQVAAANRRIRAVWTDSPFSSLASITMDRMRFWTRLPARPLRPLQWATLKVAQRRGHFDVRLVDPLALASQITCPVYLVHGDADAFINVEHSMRIFDALLSSEKHLWIIPGVGHGRGFRRATAEYGERLVAFFRGALGE